MRLKHLSHKRLKKYLLEILGKHLNLNQYRVFFFGSRVSPGKVNNDHSDIDVGIEGIKEIPFNNFSKIIDEVEEIPTLYKIDIVDFKTVSKDFYEVAKQHTEPLN